MTVRSLQRRSPRGKLLTTSLMFSFFTSSSSFPYGKVAREKKGVGWWRGLGDEGGGGTGGRKNKGQKMDWSVLWLNDDRRRREKKFWRRINPELEKGKKVERSLNE